MTHQFHPSILREYDVRGIVGDTLHEADARALGRSYAALARAEGAKRVAVGRDGRPISPTLEAALVDGLTRRRARRRADRAGRLADALLRRRDARRRWRDPGHRKPQPGRLQRLQDAAQRPLGVRRGNPGAGARRRRGRMERRHGRASARPMSATPMSRRCSRISTGRPIASAGTPATAPAARCSSNCSSACRASITRSTPTSTAAFPTTIPTRRSRRTSTT